MGSPLKFYVSYLDNSNKLWETTEISFEEVTISRSQLMSKIGQVFDVHVDDFDVFHGLHCLEQSSKRDVSDLSLKSGTRLRAIQKKVPKKVEKVDMTWSQIQNAAHGLRTMFTSSRNSRRRSKTRIMKFFADKESMDALIDSVDGAADDQTVLDILENVKLFEVVLNSKDLKSAVDKHPALGAAIVAIWDVLVRVASFGPPVGASPMPTQESMEVDDDRLSGSQNENQPSSSNNTDNSNFITSSQLAAAIAHATNLNEAGFPYSAFNTPTTSSTSPNSSQGSASTTPSTRQGRTRSRQPVITSDDFSQAMQQALMSTGLQQVAESLQNDTASGGTTSISDDVMQAGLVQLRAMGITDDAASRQALTVTQGNVEAAVNLLFSSS